MVTMVKHAEHVHVYMHMYMHAMTYNKDEGGVTFRGKSHGLPLPQHWGERYAASLFTTLAQLCCL